MTKWWVIGITAVAGSGVLWWALMDASQEYPDRSQTDAPMTSGDLMGEGRDPIGDLIAALPDTIDGAETFETHPAEVGAVPAWQRYGVAPPVLGGKPAMAIVIDDAGHDQDAIDSLAMINAPLTMAFLPYAPDLGTSVRRMRLSGHEILVHLPMEPTGNVADPGPQALLRGLDAAEFRQRLMWNLSQVEGYVGINNHMGSALTADPDSMAIVMQEAKRRGLLFLDSRTTAATVGRLMAESAGVPVLERDLFLDNEPELEKTVQQLQKGAAIARRDGFAIVIGHPYPTTIAALNRWVSTQDDVTIVPLSALIDLSRHLPAKTR